MSFASRPDPADHEQAQEAVRAARDHVHAVQRRAADGRAGPHELATAEFNLDTALQRLTDVQQGAEDAT